MKHILSELFYKRKFPNRPQSWTDLMLKLTISSQLVFVWFSEVVACVGRASINVPMWTRTIKRDPDLMSAGEPDPRPTQLM